MLYLMTGRGSSPELEARVSELVSSVGLSFDELHLKPGGRTMSWKSSMLEQLISKFPDLQTVQVWEDRSDHLEQFMQIAKEAGLEAIPHFVGNVLKDPCVLDNPIDEATLRQYISGLLIEANSLERNVDDILDDVIRDAAPDIVRDIREREVDEDIDEFIDGALHGSWDSKDLDYPDPPIIGDPTEVMDAGDNDEVTEMYRLGYEWGWDNPTKIKADQPPPPAIRAEMIEYALENFKSRVTEEFVIDAVEKATGYVKQQMGDVHDLLKKAKEKFGWKIAPAIVGIEVFEHAVLPTALGAIHPIFYGLAAVPTIEILAASALAIAKARMPASAPKEIPPGHLDWYEGEYQGAAANESLRLYIRGLLSEVNEYGWNKADRKTMGQDGKAKGRQKKNWVGQNTNDVIVNWYKKMGLAEAIGLLNEGIEFREVDSPLKYGRSGSVKRIAYCDNAVTDPPNQRDAYFKEWEKWRKYSKGGKRLKKPVLDEIVPGVSDVCIIGFLDYHKETTISTGETFWYIDYMKTRGDSQGSGVASKLIDEFYQTIPQQGDYVNFGKMMRKEIGHLKDKMAEKYPDIKTKGAKYF